MSQLHLIRLKFHYIWCISPNKTYHNKKALVSLHKFDLQHLKHSKTSTSSPTLLALLRRKTAALINHFQQEHIFRLVCWDHIKNVKHFVAACKQQLQLQQLPVNQFAVGREEEAVVISPKPQSGQAGLLHVKGGSENTTDITSDMEAHCAHLTERRMPFTQEAGKITTGG